VLYFCIPAFNEAPTIGLLLWRLRKVFQEQPLEYEVLVYDDGITDATAETLEPYEWAVRRELDPLASAGWSAKVALDRYPRAVFALLRLPVTWRVIEKLLLGEVSHPGEAQGAGGRAMQVIEGLARLARNPRTSMA
jgi:hypothetical protein